jgi:hypothetical protein
MSSAPTTELGPNRTMDGDLASVDERIAGPVVKPEPRDIELGPMPFENVEDGPKPTTFRRVFMEAVVVPTLASVLRRDDEEIQKKQEKLHNVCCFWLFQVLSLICSSILAQGKKNEKSSHEYG